MKNKLFLFFLFSLLPTFSSLQGNVIGYVEDFALAPDREAVLKDLVPGTREYYYYHALHAQNEGQHGEVEKLIGLWVKRYGETSRVREIRNRAALLEYEKNPEKSMDYLKKKLGLRFNHSRVIEGRKPAHPTKLDPKKVSYDSYYQEAIRVYKNLQGFEQRGLRNLKANKLNGIQLRDFLGRIVYPDIPGLPELIQKDLKEKQSRGFGSLSIHRNLTKKQLDELLELDPKLLNSNNFVQTYLSRLSPSADLNPEEEPEEKSAWFNRQLLFVRTLSPAFNSLKANVLYNILKHKRSLGNWDRELLLEYLALPRPVSYLRREWTQAEMKKPGARAVNFNEDFRSFGCYAPIRQETPLVRSMLLHFFDSDENFDAFSKYLTDEFLKPIFAEAKLTAGKGDAEKWYSMLSTSQLKNLRERIDLSFAHQNKQSFAPNDKVNLKLWTKNVDKLMIKEFEINAFNYYIKNRQEVSTAIELDGLTATRERVVESDLPPIRRNLRSISFPNLKKRGVYVVEFIGNGISSRALIRKGTLRLLEKIGPAGHEFRILDEKNQICDEATLWFNDKEYSHKDGVILIPFSNNPGSRTVILRDGNFASLARFNHLGENYKLQVGFHMDRESLRSGENTTLLVRPTLRLNGYPTSLKLLEEIQLVITSYDHDNQPTRMEVPIENLDPREEFAHEFRVPERTHRVEAFVEAKVESLSGSKKVNLRDNFSISINGIDQSTQTASPLLHRSSNGFVLEIRGKNGEPFVDYSVPFSFKHVDFRRTRNHTLKTDEMGRIQLGFLPNIEWLQVSTPNTQKWELEKHSVGRSHLPTLIHAVLGDSVTLPFPRLGNRFPINEFSLFELRTNSFFVDHSDKISTLPGLIEISNLPAGNFMLNHHPTGRTVTIRITDGENRSGFAVSRHHILERNYGPPLSISSIEAKEGKLHIRLANAHSSARLHVFGTAYTPIFDAHSLLQLNPIPTPSSMALAIPRTLYVEERDIGEEYRYVLERQGAGKFPGNLLPRPGLILNPWSVRSTDTQKKEAQAGADYADRKDQADLLARAVEQIAAKISGLNDKTNLDFLEHGTLLLKNLRPNKDGVVIIDIPRDKGYRMLRFLALDPIQQVSLDLPLPDAGTIPRERRMVTDLDFKTAHAKQKQVSILEAEKDFKVEDFTTSRFRSIDSLRDAYDLLLTINGSSTVREFGFLMDWPELEENEKIEKYRTYACHELHFFIYRKDRKFFDKIIRPYLESKKEPTFLDDWFLQRDLSVYLDPFRFDQLNAFEKALLSTTRFASAKEMSRHLSEKSDLIKPDLDLFDRLFEIALNSGSLDQETDELASLAKSARKQAEIKRKSMALAPVPTAAPMPMPNSGIRFGKSSSGFLSANKEKMTAKGFLNNSLSRGVNANAEISFDSTVALNDSIRSAPMEKLSEESSDLYFKAQKESMLKTKKSEKKNKNWFSYSAGYSDAVGGGAANDPFAARLGLRKQARAFYRKMGKVMEWAESNYYRITIQNQNANLIPIHSFWSDYAKHLSSDGKKPFLSGNFIYATRNANEMLLALSVLDLPFDPKKTETEIEERSVTIQPKQNLLLFHEQLLPSEQSKKSEVLMSQRFYRLDSRYRYEKGERLDNFVDEEFLPGIPYGSIVVLTNPTSSRKKLRLLLHLPNGSMPLSKTRTVRSVPVTLEAYSTRTFESSFYFPQVGKFGLYPARASSEGKSVASAPLVTFQVVKELSKKDKTSWAWISQNGTDKDVLNYLNANNLNRTDLNQIAFRLRKENEGGSGKSFYDRLLKQLDTRFHYHNTIWSYAFYHEDVNRFSEFLTKSSFANQSGLWIESPLLNLDPVDRKWYEQLEYAPLVHARAHRLGKERRILNDRLRGQYLRLLDVCKYKPALTQQDHLILTYYLLAQDRIEEGLAHFDKIDRKEVREKLQYDYFAVNAAFYRLEIDKAEKIAKTYENFSIDRWQKLFGEAMAHLKEAKAVLDPQVVDDQERDQQMDQLADSEPSFSFELVDDQIRLEHKNIESAQIRFYPMEVELLFSRQPFAKNDADHFTLVSPDGEEGIEIGKDDKQTTYRLPEKYRRQNVMIEIEAGGKRKSEAYYANRLSTEVTEEYGRIRVLDKITGNPLPKVYVKTYARMNNGQVRFYKDGYTDLRGKFEYASLNTDDLDQVQRFALLVIDPDAGAQIEEAPPPSR